MNTVITHNGLNPKHDSNTSIINAGIQCLYTALILCTNKLFDIEQFGYQRTEPNG